MIRSAALALSLMLAAALASADGMTPLRRQDLQNMLIQDCGSCHGLKMKGGLGPALLPEKLQGKSAEYISSVILYGRPGTAMPPWSSLLSADEASWMATRLLSGEWQ